MSAPFVRSAYNYDRDAASVQSGLACRDVSLAKQEFAEEVDINTIVRRFGLTGQLPSDVRMPVSGDYTGIGDFHEAMNSVRAAQESFDQMPAEVRRRFHNDAGEFVDFCLDDSNRDEAVKLGLVPPRRRVEDAPAAAPAAAASAVTP